MKIIVFGATGSVGCHIVQQALAQGHDVTAFARNPAALDMAHPNLSCIAGDVLDPRAVAQAIRGHETVLITLGSAKLTGRIRSEGTANIVDAMTALGVKRLICQTTLGMGSSYKNLNFFWKYMMFGLLLRSVFKDHIRQEDIVSSSRLDWIIIRPAAFTDGPQTGDYKHGFGSRERGLSLKIARADVAHFMLKQLDDNKYLLWTPGLST